jgi:hypothetical protein
MLHSIGITTKYNGYKYTSFKEKLTVRQYRVPIFCSTGQVVGTIVMITTDILRVTDNKGSGAFSFDKHHLFATEYFVTFKNDQILLCSLNNENQ